MRNVSIPSEVIYSYNDMYGGDRCGTGNRVIGEEYADASCDAYGCYAEQYSYTNNQGAYET